MIRALAAAVLLAGCGPMAAADYGEQLFHDPGLAESDFNAFSCATCHSTRADEDRLLSGYTMLGAASRPSFWGGHETRLIDAASFCFVYFMRGPGPFEPNESRSKALYEYLASFSPEPSSAALPLTIVQQIADVPRGDPSEGAKVYRAACQECHGEIHTGGGRLTALAPILPEVQSGYADLFPGVPPALVFIEKVRHGQFFGVGGNMPPFSLEALSDEQLGALLAYLGL